MRKRKYITRLIFLPGLLLLAHLHDSALAQETVNPKDCVAANLILWTAWPVTPKTDDIAGIQVVGPNLSLPPNDPFKQARKDVRFPGVFAYTPRIKLPDDPIAQRFLILRKLNMGIEADKESSAQYTVLEGNDELFDPQFSPNGQRMLLKDGDPVSGFGSYALRLWDFSTKTLKQISDVRLSYREVIWSPDSKFLAYVKGGDKNGQSSELAEGKLPTPELHVYSVITGQDRFVARLSQVIDFTWSKKNSLFYTVNDPSTEWSGSPSRAAIRTRPRSSVYEVSMSAATVPPRKVISDAFNPAPSPDGKRIIFSGWKSAASAATGSPNSALLAATRPSLFILDREKGLRTSLGKSVPPEVCWLPNANQFILAFSGGAKLENGKGKAVTSLVRVDANSLEQSDLAKIVTEDFKLVQRSLLAPAVKPLHVTDDGKFLFVKTSEFNSAARRGYVEKTQILAVDLKTGKTVTVAGTVDPGRIVNGISWYDGATH